ncbi:MAG: hypothetical protein M1827_004208 [Pycnora praestabilis]|nr:MAG: hypothetical protein M1827_004208 [Pycnora praestabilis]
MFFPCKTTHTRITPKKHSFTYSYLYCGIPVGWRGSVSTILSADARATPGFLRGRTWFSVDAADYLSRIQLSSGLQGKLRAYLATQGISDDEYPYAYFITAPRFLGYAFNPVSFWYLYSSSRELKAMILEVNNTFDERRMYLLKANTWDAPGSDPGDDRTKPCEPQHNSSSQAADRPALPDITPKGSSRFRNAWDKDFHVSPFNSRKGIYSMVSDDPMVQYAGAKGPVNTTITMTSPEEQSTMVARVFSVDAAIDPATLSPLSVLRFVLSWWWVGLVTFPRILKEAGRLFNKKMYVFNRPEVKEKSLGRHETKTEKYAVSSMISLSITYVGIRTLERYFRGYLKQQVEQCETTLAVKYTAAAEDHPRREETYVSSAKTHSYSTLEYLEITVITPAFYSRFVHYLDPLEAFQKEFLEAVEENKTIGISKPGLLPLIFAHAKETDNSFRKGEESSYSTYTESWGWSLLNRLRSLPPEPNYASKSSSSSDSLSDNKLVSSHCQIDDFVKEHCSCHGIMEYKETVIELFLSEKIALGYPALLHFYDFLLRLFLAYGCWQFTGHATLALLKSAQTHRFTELSLIATVVWNLLLVHWINIWAVSKRLCSRDHQELH